MPLRGCCNRPCGKRALMRRPVNPARQTRDDNLPGGPQFGGDILRETLGVGRRVPRGHNGNHRPLQSIGVSLDEQVRRRIGDGRQRVRIFGVAHRDYALARVGEPVEFRVNIILWRRDQLASSFRAARNLGKFCDRRGGIAEAFDKLDKGAGSHGWRANEPQPVVSLRIRQRHGDMFHVLKEESAGGRVNPCGKT